MDTSTLKNQYFLMRHGESEANAKNIIVSDPKNGCDDFGLTKYGINQVIESTQRYSGRPISKIVCSDFLRTLQTAQIVAEILSLPKPEQDEGLRERFFGHWEGMSSEHYQSIWQHDVTNKTLTDGVETAGAVLERGLKVLYKLEQQHQDQVILIVSHGDTLQILRTAFANIPAREHRLLAHHETAEIKQLIS